MTSSGKPPISSHPAFKWAVGLWFAALLGLGLFVMPGAIHDLLVTRTGLASVAPFAEPPVGAAGRAVLAGIAALLGLLFGLVLARHVARANAEENYGEVEDEPVPDLDAPVSDPDGRQEELADAPASHPVRRVFNPREDIDEDGIDYIPRAESSPQDPADELIEDQGVDALMEAWREETALAGDYLPELVDEQHAPVDSEPGEHRATQTSEIEFDSETWEEPKVDENAFASAPDAASPLAATGDAPGDMSLSALTERLRRAITEADARAAAAAAMPASIASEDTDDVLAFLEREARRVPADNGGPPSGEDPQSILRNALEKLSHVSNPK